MARIPESELARLKAEVSIERLALARGLTLTKKGRDLYTRCLFHPGDNEGSLVISPAKNLWHCLGCGAGGSVLDWTMRVHGVSLRHAVELLRADLPASAAPGAGEPSVVQRSTVRKLPRVLPTDADDQVLLGQVVDFYHETLKQSPEALAYLQERGLTDPGMVTHFKLGFANRTLGYRLPTKTRKEGAALRGRLEALGIYRESGHEHLAGSVTIPVFDAEGRVVQMYGRKVTPRLRPGTPNHLYLPSPQRGVWNLEALKASREVILCEALIDALTFWCAGYRNVTTAYGVGGLTKEHWEAFAAHRTERVLIAFDRDEAGEKAAAELAPKLQAAGIEALRIQFPRGMDANEYACKVKPAGKSLGLVIRNAVWLGQGQAPRPSGPARQEETPAGPPASIPGEKGTGKAAERKGRGNSPPLAPAPAAAIAPAPVAVPPARIHPVAVPPPARIPAPPPPTSLPSAAVPVAPPAGAAPAPAGPPLPGAGTPGRPLVLEPDGEALQTRLGDRAYRIQGLAKNTSYGPLKVSLRVARDGQQGPGSAGYHLDTLDLAVARQRQAFIGQAAAELGHTEETLKRDLDQLVLALELARDQAIDHRLAPAAQAEPMGETDRAAALELLRAPDLLDQVLADFSRCGVVGEETNKLVGYLAAVSRKLTNPLAVVIQSSSAAGKSSLMDAVLAFIPEEERVVYSAMTGQALFYMSETKLAHKILAIAEEEGAQRATYSLKLLQSEGKLKIASTGKDPDSGKQVTHIYEVEGPVMLFLTTTALDTDEELMNRCLLLTVDEGRTQTRAIHRLQRERKTLEGLLEDQERGEIVRRHQNAQRLLRPLRVVNHFARGLTFLDHQTRTRRDHMKYLTLIEAIALLHQYQREVKTARTKSGTEIAYIEVTEADLALADRLARQVLPQSFDELAPQTRRLLGEIVGLVEARCQAQGIPRAEFRFTRRDVREVTGMGNTQLKHHLKRLEELEYLWIHSGSRGHSLVYELADETPAAPPGGGVEGQKAAGTTPQVGGADPQVGVKSGSSRPQVGAKSAPLGEPESGTPGCADLLPTENPSKTQHPGGSELDAVVPARESYRQPGRANGGGG